MTDENLVLTVGTNTIKKTLEIFVNETMTALAESIEGLEHSDLWREIIPGKHMIGTMFLHSLATLDIYGCGFLSGKEMYGIEHWFDMWTNPPEEVRKQKTEFPTRGELLERLRKITDISISSLSNFDDLALVESKTCDSWWNQTGRNFADGLIRVVGHVNGHVRQIWALRGLIGKVDPNSWPQQHLA